MQLRKKRINDYDLSLNPKEGESAVIY